MPPSRGPESRRVISLATGVILLTTGMAISTLVDAWSPAYDSAVYLELAESVAAGEGLRYQGHEFPKYPPGLPLVLAPFTRLETGSFLAMRGLMVLCALAGLFAAWRLLRREHGADPALAAVAVTAVAPTFVETLVVIVSELPYFLVWTLALLAGRALIEAPSWRRLLIVVGLCLLAALLRTAGLTLLPALAAALILRPGARPGPRRWALAAVLLLLPVAYLAVTATLRGTPSNPIPAEIPLGSTYGRQLFDENPFDPESRRLETAEFLGRVIETVPAQLGELGRQISAERLGDPTLRLLLGALWLPAFLVSLIRRRRLLEIAIAAHLAPLLVWPFLEARYLLLILPFVLSYVFWSIDLVVRRLARSGAGARLARGAILGLALLLVAMHITRSWRLVERERALPVIAGRPGDTVEAIHWMGRELPDDAVVVADRAPWVLHYTGLRSYGFLRVEDPARVLAVLDRHGTTHVVACHRPGSRRFLEPVLAAWPHRFELQHQVGETRVFRLRPPPR